MRPKIRLSSSRMNRPELESFVGMSPAPMSCQPPSVLGSCCTHTAHFFDEHLAEDLALKRVITMDDLGEKLRDLGEAALCELDTRHELNWAALSDACHSTDVEAEEGVHRVTEFYRAVADMSRHLAHAFVFQHGAGGGWTSKWSSLDDTNTRVLSPSLLTHTNFALRTLPLDSPPTNGSSKCKKTAVGGPVLTQYQRKRERTLQRSSVILAVWMMVQPSLPVDHALEKMSKQAQFPWRYPATSWRKRSGGSADRGRYQKDASLGPCAEWIRPIASLPRRSPRNHTPPVSRKAPVPQFVTSTPFNRETLVHDSNHFIQRLWTESVRSDTTFMIFHSGNSQRIGIRQRATQTLVLSPLIPISHNSEYTRIQVGLHVAIMQDALARDKELGLGRAEVHSVGSAPPLLGKRKQKEWAVSGNKRLKLDPGIFDNSDGLLLTIQSHVYDSPTPCLLFRVQPAVRPSKASPHTSYKPPRLKSSSKRRTVKPSRCISLTASQVLGSGSTGFAQLADFISSTNNAQHPPLAGKLAFGDEGRLRLFHEAAIYERLRERKVKEVPQYFGLFEDENESVAVLVTEYTGPDMHLETLTEKVWMDSGMKKNVRLHELDVRLRPALRRAIESIHRAGVLHNDFKFDNVTKILGHSSPEQDILYLIDFDRAILDPTREQMERELSRVKEISEGVKGYCGFGPSPGDFENEPLSSSMEALGQVVERWRRGVVC
ncbi:hypothetical protein DL96DRAFT_1620554 [Flagelloscypha sp. PMI_526]|nr:hypothetical protein DL96DRAFT_1620554 [Flagelloscypha sp. PMI_526]